MMAFFATYILSKWTIITYVFMTAFLSTYLSKWTQLTYSFYDGIFFDHTSLKILANAKALSAFFALSSRKICSVKKGTYLCPLTY